MEKIILKMYICICMTESLCRRAVINTVQFSRSVMSDSLRLHGLQHARPPSLSITSSQSLLKLMFIESVLPSNHLILCCLFSHLQSLPASGSFQISQLFVSGGQSIALAFQFSFSISTSNEYSGLISFKIDRLDLLAV